MEDHIGSNSRFGKPRSERKKNVITCGSQYKTNLPYFQHGFPSSISSKVFFFNSTELNKLKPKKRRRIYSLTLQEHFPGPCYVSVPGTQVPVPERLPEGMGQNAWGGSRSFLQRKSMNQIYFQIFFCFNPNITCKYFEKLNGIKRLANENSTPLFSIPHPIFLTCSPEAVSSVVDLPVSKLYVCSSIS